MTELTEAKTRLHQIAENKPSSTNNAFNQQVVFAKTATMFHRNASKRQTYQRIYSNFSNYNTYDVVQMDMCIQMYFQKTLIDYNLVHNNQFS